ncbi:MAG TPA: ferric reductase-like transmembrane domain-containing protein [Prolixibacteraceae bacterium]|nr:ferric reductase-like transmembrane domain-containing protein [Prolixibacteraceae bacterium]
MNNFKERLKIHYLPLLSIVFIASIMFHYNWPKRDTITFITGASGYISLILITFSLLIGPFNLLFNRINPISTYFRRDIGITGGVLAVIHSVAGLFVHLRGSNWKYFLNKTDAGYSIRLDDFGLANYTGLISALILIVLLSTSNDFSFRKLNPFVWKNIQRFIYLAFLFAIVHSIYYKVVQTNLSLVWYLYLPLFLTVLLIQIAGIRIKSRKI